MPKLTLDHRQRHPLTGELDSMRMPQLVVVPTSVGTTIITPTCSICRRRRASPRRVGARRLEIGITRAAPIVLDGSVTGDEPSPGGGTLTWSAAGRAASK